MCTLSCDCLFKVVWYLGSLTASPYIFLLASTSISLFGELYYFIFLVCSLHLVWYSLNFTISWECHYMKVYTSLLCMKVMMASFLTISCLSSKQQKLINNWVSYLNNLSGLKWFTVNCDLWYSMSVFVSKQGYGNCHGSFIFVHHCNEVRILLLNTWIYICSKIFCLAKLALKITVFLLTNPWPRSHWNYFWTANIAWWYIQWIHIRKCICGFREMAGHVE